MSFNPALRSNVDKVRLNLGDVNPEYPILPDETYISVLTDFNDDVERATAHLARALWIQATTMPDSMNVGGAQYTWRELIKGWYALATGAAKGGADLPPQNTSGTKRMKRGDDAQRERQRKEYAEYIAPELWWERYTNRG